MSRRKFVYFIFFFFCAVYAYLAFSLGSAFNPAWPLWAFLALPFAAVMLEFALIIASIVAKEGETPFELPARVHAVTRRAAYFSMAALSFLLTITLVRDLVGLMPGLFDALHSPQATLLVFAVTVVLTLVGWFTAARGLIVRNVAIALDAKNATALSGFKIAQITDLHIGAMIGAEYVKRVVDKTNALGADVIVLTGDIGDGEVAEHQAAIVELGKLKARHRVFYVTGNHEFYWDGAGWINQMRKLGIEALTNSNSILTIGTARLAVAGILDPAAMMVGERSDLTRAMQGAESADYKILLAHQPSIAPLAEKAGFDLQISGHTHGGQFFPWTLVVRLVHRFHRGWFVHGRMQLYVNPGTGTWGPPVRLGATPEITLMRLGLIE